jgi:hypothetical protein
LTGEGQGGGDKIEIKSYSYLFTLPLFPSHRGRGKLVAGQLVNPVATKKIAFKSDYGADCFSNYLPDTTLGY